MVSVMQPWWPKHNGTSTAMYGRPTPIAILSRPVISTHPLLCFYIPQLYPRSSSNLSFTLTSFQLSRTEVTVRQVTGVFPVINDFSKFNTSSSRSDYWASHATFITPYTPFTTLCTTTWKFSVDVFSFSFSSLIALCSQHLGVLHWCRWLFLPDYPTCEGTEHWIFCMDGQNQVIPTLPPSPLSRESNLPSQHHLTHSFNAEHWDQSCTPMSGAPPGSNALQVAQQTCMHLTLSVPSENRWHIRWIHLWILSYMPSNPL